MRKFSATESSTCTTASTGARTRSSVLLCAASPPCPRRSIPPAVPLPRPDVHEVFVVTQRLAVFGLVFLAEMTAAAFVALQRVQTHQLGKLQVVGNSSGLLERLVPGLVFAQHTHVLPELLA